MSVESERDEITKSRALLAWRKRDAESTGECPTVSGAGGDNGPGDEPAGDPFPEGDGQPARAHDLRRTPALERLLARTGAIGKRWERERSTAGLLYQCLVAEGPARRAELLATDQRFASPALVENVLSEAGEAARNRPTAALEHVEMAQAIIERIDALRFAGGALAGLRVAAQARKAEALWWGGDPPGAKAVLLGALDDVEETPVAGLERALYCRVTALVRAGQGRSDEGLALLGRACQIYYQEQETAALAECLVERGWLLAEAEPRTAVPPLRRALSLIDPVARPWAALRVRQCLALCHAELGNGAEAESMLRQSRRLRKRISRKLETRRRRSFPLS